MAIEIVAMIFWTLTADWHANVTAPLLAAQGDPLGFFILLIGVAIFVAVAIGRQWYEKKRTEQLAKVADELGLSFSAKNAPLPPAATSFELFSRGRKTKASNAIYGEANGVQLVVFDYQFTVGSGKNARTYRQTAISITSPELNLPRFLVRPRKSFLGLSLFGPKNVFAHKDIRLNDASEYSKQFMVSGDDEDAIHALFPEGLEPVTQGSPTLTIEGCQDQLLVYRSKQRVRPEEIKSLMQTGFHVYTTLRPS
ncbi:MAG: hypothetical protein D6800_02955 [Candidatus Zixiibacteriota bacterium]|nr:MAG: hypothetical protein D6800_02955 [candidate division Zixibacteria bacterium]